MAKESGRITFYDIERCGYYKRGKSNPEFREIESTLDDLNKWAFHDGMILGQTCTYETGDYGPAYRTFCFDLVKDKDTNTYLLTTWNEVPSSVGKIASVRSLDPVGGAEVSLTDLPKNSIPGYATYFWFLPNKSLLATIQFQHKFNGRENLEAYVRGFLAKFSSHAVTDLTHDSTIVLGYRKNSSGEIDKSIHPQFNSLLHKKVGQIEFIRNNWSKIRKIIRKETIVFSIEQKREMWQALLQRVGVSRPHYPNEESERFRFELNYSPAKQEVEEMLAFWQQDGRIETKWDDLGFKLEGETEIRWLSHCLARSEFTLEVIRENDEIVKAKSLLEQLVAHQQSILGLLS